MNVGTRLTKTGALDHLRTLSDVVRDYLVRFRFKGEGYHNPVIDHVVAARSWAEAIERAVDGRRADGKLFSQGSCIRTKSKDKLYLSLLDEAHSLKKSGTFRVLYDSVREARPYGIGETHTYNVALCLGVYLGIEPEDLYLHAGPLIGWKRLTGERGNPYRIPWSGVPAPLRRLSPHRLEDCLCEYRDVLRPDMLPRGWKRSAA